MKKLFSPRFLPWFILATGSMGLLLRTWLLTDGFDEKGFLIHSHPAELLLWLLTAVTLGLLAVGCLPLVQASKYSFNFPASPVGATGEIAAAAGILAVSILNLSTQLDGFAFVAFSAGVLTVPTLCFCAWCRLKGSQPPFYLHGIICIFWILRLIVQYRIWSPDPQLQDYCFQLMATVFLMLSSYQQTAFAADLGNRRMYAFFHLAALYFCCVAIPYCQDWPLYLGCSVWIITNLCNLIPMPNWTSQKTKEDE